MKYQKTLAALLLSTALAASPIFASTALAHDGDAPGKKMQHCEHHSSLSTEQMDLLHTTMLNTHEANKATYAELHELHQKQHDLLAAKNFDKDAYLANAAQMAEKRATIDKTRAEAFASIADKFTPQQREHLAHMFGHHYHGHWHHHHGMMGKDGNQHHSQPDMKAMPPAAEPTGDTPAVQ